MLDPAAAVGPRLSVRGSKVVRRPQPEFSTRHRQLLLQVGDKGFDLSGRGLSTIPAGQEHRVALVAQAGPDEARIVAPVEVRAR